MTSFNHFDVKKDQPVVEIPPEHRELIRACRAAILAKAAAREELERCRAALRPVSDAVWRACCRRDRTYHWAVHLNGCDVGLIRAIYRPYCATMKLEDEPRLRSIFGDSNFDRYFKLVTEMQINREELSDDELITAINAVVGALGESAYKVFSALTQIVAREQYFLDRILDKRIAEKAARAEAESLAVPYKACFAFEDHTGNSSPVVQASKRRAMRREQSK